MIRRYFGRMVSLALALLLWKSPAWACPLCESESGERVRAGIFNADFGYNIAVTVLPFSVFLAIVALIHFGWPWAKTRSGQITPLDVGANESSIQNEEDKSWTTG